MKEETLRLSLIIGVLIAMSGAAFAQDGAAKIAKPGRGSSADSGTMSQGIARDPQEVQAQQGNAAKASPGTVGAAPGANTPSQQPSSGK